MEYFSAPTDYDFVGAMATSGVTCGPYFSVLPPFRNTTLLTHEDKKLINSRHQTISHRTVSCSIHTRHTSLSSISRGLGFATHGSELRYAFGQLLNFTGVPREHYPAVAPIESFIQVSLVMVSKW